MKPIENRYLQYLNTELWTANHIALVIDDHVERHNQWVKSNGRTSGLLYNLHSLKNEIRYSFGNNFMLFKQLISVLNDPDIIKFLGNQHEQQRLDAIEALENIIILAQKPSNQSQRKYFQLCQAALYQAEECLLKVYDIVERTQVWHLQDAVITREKTQTAWIEGRTEILRRLHPERYFKYQVKKGRSNTLNVSHHQVMRTLHKEITGRSNPERLIAVGEYVDALCFGKGATHSQILNQARQCGIEKIRIAVMLEAIRSSLGQLIDGPLSVIGRDGLKMKGFSNDI